MVAALLLLAAAGEAMPPPPTWRGPHFLCRLTDRAGENFTVSGTLGEGRRRNPTASERNPAWHYHYDEARIEDGQARFEGAPILATSTTNPNDLSLSVRYAAGRNGRRISIDERGNARLTEDNSGDVLADGLCRLTFAPRVASLEMETRR